MAFTGDLEHLHIVDIIQLIHTTRKSGTFSVTGSSGESRIIFSNGYIVGANHLSGKIRIGTVLVKMNAITLEDLEKALEIQKNAGKDRRPLIATLIKMGKLRLEEASKGLKKLIEITIVELLGCTHGAFTFDTEAIAVSPECSYTPDKMEQEISLDAQMVLMDALRIFDEQERDRSSGKQMPPYEKLFEEVIPSAETVESKVTTTAITAEDLGLADIEHLEKKIPKPFSVHEIFDPIEIHRQNIRETLGNFSTEEQEAFISFLKKFTMRVNTTKELTMEGQTKAIILFSRDKLLKHSIMTICKNEGILVFATEAEEEFDSIIAQCLFKKILPLLIFDSPEMSEWGLSEEKILSLRQHIQETYLQVSHIQLVSPLDYSFTLQSFNDGARAVFPKPLREDRKETFIEDMINFLNTFKFFIKGLLREQKDLSPTDNQMKNLKDRMLVLIDLKEPPDLSLALLQSVSEIFERSITFIVRPKELIGEKAIGVYAEKNIEPTSAANLRIPLTEHSVFRDVIEKGQAFYGESDDKFLKEYLFEKIGAPLKPIILLLPVKSLGKTMILIYGDFDGKEALPTQIDVLEILANQAGLVLENAIYRKHLNKASQK
ncbi:MAG: DUF4388 domain-containing protein [Nitrospirota bacterium]